MRILLLEDDQKINDMLTLYLKQDGHSVMPFYHAEAALEAFNNNPFDLIISDLMLKGIQGETFIKTIRKKSAIHIIVLTAKAARNSKLSLLHEGVDDYITKPFSIDEVQLKLRNIERRLNREQTLRFIYNNNHYTLKEKTDVFMCNAVKVPLTSKEIRILRFFMKNPMQILTRGQIIEHCLHDSEAFDRIVDAYIKNIRHKLLDKSLIETVYGEGYRFRGERHA